MKSLPEVDKALLARVDEIMELVPKSELQWAPSLIPGTLGQKLRLGHTENGEVYSHLRLDDKGTLVVESRMHVNNKQPKMLENFHKFDWDHKGLFKLGNLWNSYSTNYRVLFIIIYWKTFPEEFRPLGHKYFQ